MTSKFLQEDTYCKELHGEISDKLEKILSLLDPITAPAPILKL